jgi:arylsulfatase A-like enzyme
VTTRGRGNHAVRSQRWRYIRYQDGSEELYDHDADPNEWTNLAAHAASARRTAAVRAELRRALPATEAPDAPRQVGAGEP